MHLILYSMAYKFYPNAFIFKVFTINKTFTIIAVVRFFVKTRWLPNFIQMLLYLRLLQ
jgi:hypothetical protein